MLLQACTPAQSASASLGKVYAGTESPGFVALRFGANPAFQDDDHMTAALYMAVNGLTEKQWTDASGRSKLVVTALAEAGDTFSSTNAGNQVASELVPSGSRAAQLIWHYVCVQ